MNLIDFMIGKMFHSPNVKIAPIIDNAALQAYYQRQARDFIQQAQEMDEISTRTVSFYSLGNSSSHESIHTIESPDNHLLEKQTHMFQQEIPSIEKNVITCNNISIPSNTDIDALTNHEKTSEVKVYRHRQKRIIGPDSEQARRNRHNLKLVPAELRQ